jgi:serine/threonine protein kinase
MNIVRILRHDWLVHRLHVYYIDMELCSLTLADYIKGSRHAPGPPELVRSIRTSFPAFILNDRVEMKMLNMWAIGLHIAKGLEFMHSHKHAHRDLKPNNGKYFVGSALIISSIL